MGLPPGIGKMTDDQATPAGSSVGAPIGAEPPQLTGPQPLTDALIDAVANGHCGWSRRQIEILGAPWPLVAGWREKLVSEARTLTGEEVEALYDARKKPKRPEGADDTESPLVPAPCPWCRRLVEPVTQGGNLKEFCSKKHKNSYNAALNRLSLAYARTIRTPGSLQMWAAGRVDLTENAVDALPRTTEAVGQQETPSAAPHDKA